MFKYQDIDVFITLEKSGEVDRRMFLAVKQVS